MERARAAGTKEGAREEEDPSSSASAFDVDDLGTGTGEDEPVPFGPLLSDISVSSSMPSPSESVAERETGKRLRRKSREVSTGQTCRK